MALDNLTRLGHMRDAAREAIEFVSGRTRIDLENNRMLLLAVVKDLEIIGEAARNVTVDCRDRHPQLPWIDIISMRNRLTHAYFGIDLNIVWDTVIKDLPVLMSELDRIIQQESQNP
jgi:uncharacterized protein with HEPN domain